MQKLVLRLQHSSHMEVSQVCVATFMQNPEKEFEN